MADSAAEAVITVHRPFDSDVLSALETKYSDYYDFEPTFKNAIDLLKTIENGAPDPSYFEGAKEISEAIEADCGESVEKAVENGSNFIISLTPKGKYFIPLEKAVKLNKLEAFKALLSLFQVDENDAKQRFSKSHDGASNDSCDKSSETSGDSAGKRSKKLFRPFGLLPLIKRNVQRSIENRERKRLESETKEMKSRSTDDTGVSTRSRSPQTQTGVLINIDPLLDSLLVLTISMKRTEFVKHIIDESKFTITPSFLNHLELAIRSNVPLDLLNYLLTKSYMNPDPSLPSPEINAIALLEIAAESNNYVAYVALIKALGLELTDVAVKRSIERAVYMKKTHFMIMFIKEFLNYAKYFKDEHGNSLIHLGVKYFDDDLLVFLVSSEFRFEVHNYHSQTPLFLAFLVNNIKAFDYLYEKGEISKSDLCETIQCLELPVFEKHISQFSSRFTEEFIPKLAQYLIQKEKYEHANILFKHFNVLLNSTPFEIPIKTSEEDFITALKVKGLKHFEVYVLSDKGTIRNVKKSKSSSPKRRIPETAEEILRLTRNDIKVDKKRVLKPTYTY